MRVIDKNGSICVFVIEKDDVDKDSINDYMRSLILKLKRKYKKNISGFYVVHVYCNKFGMLFELVKEDDVDFLGDMIDLKVIMHDDDVFLEFEDYFLLDCDDIYFLNDKYYVNIKDISYDSYLSICEFCSFVFGNKLKDIRVKMKKVLC